MATDALTAKGTGGLQRATTRQALRALERREDLAMSFTRMRLLEVQRNLEGDLEAITARIAQARDEGETVSPSWLYRERRYRTLLRRVLDETEALSTEAMKDVIRTQRAALDVGRAYAQKSMSTAGVDALMGDWDADVARTIIAGLNYGTPLDALIQSIAGDTTAAVRAALITGVATGKGVDWMRAEVQRALDIPRWRAETIIRTESMRAFRYATKETFTEAETEAGVMDGWTWVAALDSRTCPACVVMHGTTHDLDSVLDGHPNCRCVMVPKTVGWDDILGEGHGLPETSPPIQSGKDWLEGQPEAVQKAVLGPAKWRAWKDGRITLDDVVTQHHSPTWGSHRREASLAEIARRKGLDPKTVGAKAPPTRKGPPGVRAAGWDPRWDEGRGVALSRGIGERAARRLGTKPVPANMPDYDPDNPLKFYGNRVVVQDGSATSVKHLKDLEGFSPGVHHALREHLADRKGAGFYIGDGGVPGLDDLGHLKGVRPRGYPPGSTWDNVGGAYNPGSRVAALGNTNRSGSVSTALHEGSHALDDFLGGVSGQDQFREAWSGYISTDRLRVSPYFSPTGNPKGWTSEAFAEGFAAYTKAGGWEADLNDKARAIGRALTGHRERDFTPGQMAALRKIAAYFDEIEDSLVVM